MKHRNRFILTLLTFILLLSSFSVSFAEEEDYIPKTVEEAVYLANKEIEEKYHIPNYYDISQVNKEVWEKYGTIVYGSPHGDVKNGMHRYLGYTPDGMPYGNPVFPRDDWTGGYFDDRNWIEAPWDNPETQSRGAKRNPFNFNGDDQIGEEYTKSMMAGLYKYYPNDTNLSRTDWHKYMLILQPPTKYTPGYARMWHQNAQGQIWYTVMPLPSLSEAENMWPDIEREMQKRNGSGSGGSSQQPSDDGDLDLPDPPKVVLTETREPNVAIKWDTVPLKIGQTGTLTAKLQRNSKSVTWNRYEIVVEQNFQGSVRGTSKVKVVGYDSNFFLSKNNTWYDLQHSGKPKYTVPSNGKPGTVLIAKLTVWSRITDKFPDMPPAPKKPDAPPDSPQYQIYLRKKADYDRLSNVYSTYNSKEDKTPTIIPVTGYNFSEYARYHQEFNNFVNSHIKRYVSIEGSNKTVYWFRKSEVSASAQSKNTIIHIPHVPGKGGLDPGILVPKN